MNAKTRETKPPFSLAYYRKDKRITELVKTTHQKILAAWAID
jgi:hypothetical protein